MALPAGQSAHRASASRALGCKLLYTLQLHNNKGLDGQLPHELDNLVDLTGWLEGTSITVSADLCKNSSSKLTRKEEYWAGRLGWNLQGLTGFGLSNRWRTSTPPQELRLRNLRLRKLAEEARLRKLRLRTPTEAPTEEAPPGKPRHRKLQASTNSASHRTTHDRLSRRPSAIIAVLPMYTVRCTGVRFYHSGPFARTRVVGAL